jgi:hypothetical protein
VTVYLHRGSRLCSAPRFVTLSDAVRERHKAWGVGGVKRHCAVLATLAQNSIGAAVDVDARTLSCHARVSSRDQTTWLVCDTLLQDGGQMLGARDCCCLALERFIIVVLFAQHRITYDAPISGP